MIKINEIVFSIADLYPEYNSYLNDRYYNIIAVFDNKILLSYTLTIKNLNYINKRTLYDMDLSGDNFKEPDYSSDFELTGVPFHLGFDNRNENIRLLSDGKINNYKYLSDNKYHKIYTLIIHSYDVSTSGTCDIYINDKLYKENISFGGQTIYRTFGNLDIFRAKSENMVTDSFLIIAGYNEAEKSYKILYYSDDSDVDLSFNFQIKDAVYTKGYLLIGAYSPSSEGYIDLKLIKGGTLDAIPNE
ncbi:MAG TPA: hypothetical protein PK899_02610 [Spirochaetota bacterium]|nr:hypothetical protein [Spirochaetota bacterium]